MIISINHIFVPNNGEIWLESLIMDKLVIIYAANAFEHVACDPNDGYSCLCHYYTCSWSIAAITIISFCTTRGNLIRWKRREDLGSGIASDVLDSVGVEDEQEEENEGAAAIGDDDGNTNTQIAVQIIDQDQRAANVGVNLAAQLDLDITNVNEEEEVQPEEEPPEEGDSFVSGILQSKFVASPPEMSVNEL